MTMWKIFDYSYRQYGYNEGDRDASRSNSLLPLLKP